MVNHIKKASDIPAWFKLENYEFTQKLDALGWYHQLAIRTVCSDQASTCVEMNKPFPKSLQLLIQALRDNPNSDIIRDNKLSNYCDPKTLLPGLPGQTDPFEFLDPQKQSPHMLGIYSISIKDYMSVRHLLGEKKFTQAEKWFNAATEEEALPFEEPWMDKPLYSAYEEPLNEICDLLCIDLSRSDKSLVESFKKYLETRRKNQPLTIETPKYFQETDFKHWSKLGILPFLDLSILEHELIEKIPYRVLADAIHPSGDRGEENIRKTIKPLASLLIQCTSLVQLSMQAAQELAEKNLV